MRSVLAYGISGSYAKSVAGLLNFHCPSTLDNSSIRNSICVYYPRCRCYHSDRFLVFIPSPYIHTCMSHTYIHVYIYMYICIHGILFLYWFSSAIMTVSVELCPNSCFSAVNAPVCRYSSKAWTEMSWDRFHVMVSLGCF